MLKPLIINFSLQKVSMVCCVENPMKTKYLFEDICMVMICLSAPRLDKALEKSSLLNEHLFSFLNVFCMYNMDLVTIFILLVKFFQGSQEFFQNLSPRCWWCKCLLLLPSHIDGDVDIS